MRCSDTSKVVEARLWVRIPTLSTLKACGFIYLLFIVYLFFFSIWLYLPLRGLNDYVQWSRCPIASVLCELIMRVQWWSWTAVDQRSITWDISTSQWIALQNGKDKPCCSTKWASVDKPEAKDLVEQRTSSSSRLSPAPPFHPRTRAIQTSWILRSGKVNA